MLISRNVSLKPFNTFGIDVNAQIMVDIADPDNLDEVYTNTEFIPLPKMVLGGGSNVLFTGNQRKVILRMMISGIHVVSENQHEVVVKIGAGENWHQFVLWCIENNLGGVENLSLIPGTVGAAPMQNIGAYGVELKDVFHSLEAYNVKSGEIRSFSSRECKFGYRYSIFKGDAKDKYVITSVTLKLSKKPKFNIEYGAIRTILEKNGVDQLSIKAVSDAVIEIRQSKLPDPAVIGNAGSFFKNPIIEMDHYEALQAAFPNIPSFPVSDHWIKVPAAWLIDQCGWKGKKRGDIGVHEDQALVLVNYGGGKGSEILKLSSIIVDSVSRKFGVDLQREVNIY